MISVICERARIEISPSKKKKIGTAMMIGGPALAGGAIAGDLLDDDKEKEGIRRVARSVGIGSTIVGAMLRRTGKHQEEQEKKKRR